MVKGTGVQWFREDVRHHVGQCVVLDFDEAGFDLLTDPVVMDLHVLGPAKEYCVVGKVNGAQVVAVKGEEGGRRGVC